MKVIKWLDENIETYLTFMFYTYLTLIVFIEVIRRYILNYSSTWGTETAIYAFIWMTYIAAAKGVKERSHLSIDVLVRFFNRKWKFLSMILSDISFLILAVTIFFSSFAMIQMNFEYNHMMLGINLPMWLATIAIPVGWFLIIIRVIQRSIVTVKRYRNNEPLEKVPDRIQAD